MSIATKGAVKNITPEELRQIGAPIVLGNTYHLWLHPGDELIAKAGGLHRFMDWSGPILTDSGGFQVFSLGARAKSKYGKNGVKICDEGVEFSDPESGTKYFMSPEKSIEIQLNLDSDIIMVFDECPPFPCTHDEAAMAVRRTTDWARRCLAYFNARVRDRDQEKRPLIFCIVQGGIFEDLRIESANQLCALGEEFSGRRQIGWDGYAVGGVAVGEPREKMPEILEWVLPILPEDKPRYLMGLGRPEELVAAVRAGVDMFDCVIPTREGRHGRLFVRKEKWNKDDLDGTDFYEAININNEKFREDFSKADDQCDCLLCKNYTKAYLRHLFSVKEPLALRLAALHNLKFYMDLMKKLRLADNEE
jgi:queuine tRNA-ribosyltransferase